VRNGALAIKRPGDRVVRPSPSSSRTRAPPRTRGCSPAMSGLSRSCLARCWRRGQTLSPTGPPASRPRERSRRCAWRNSSRNQRTSRWSCPSSSYDLPAGAAPVLPLPPDEATPTPQPAATKCPPSSHHRVRRSLVQLQAARWRQRPHRQLDTRRPRRLGRRQVRLPRHRRPRDSRVVACRTLRRQAPKASENM
jgi:hypothetical protein